MLLHEVSIKNVYSPYKDGMLREKYNLKQSIPWSTMTTMTVTVLLLLRV